jgi:hypothetical protein
LQLLSLAKKPNKKLAESAATALKDLFVQGYLTEPLGRIQKLSIFQKNALLLTRREKCSE